MPILRGRRSRDDCDFYIRPHITVYNALSLGLCRPVPAFLCVKKRNICRVMNGPNEGDLIQIDGCSHDWFMNGHKITLHGAIDDATHKVVALYFCANECLLGYYQLLFPNLYANGRAAAACDLFRPFGVLFRQSRGYAGRATSGRGKIRNAMAENLPRIANRIDCRV